MQPLYASIGALIIDDIIYRDGTEVTNVLGGGGVFAIYGKKKIISFALNN